MRKSTLIVLSASAGLIISGSHLESGEMTYASFMVALGLLAPVAMLMRYALHRCQPR